MVGIVVVSHSEEVARGIKVIAEEMSGADTVHAVGGTADGRIGTTPDTIVDALEAALSDNDAVVVTVDLGSAVMNAELAIEMAGVESAAVIADAPVLEGTVNAAVTATAPDATQESVLAAATDARDLSKL